MKKLLLCLSLLCVISVLGAAKSADPKIKGFMRELKLDYEENDTALIVKDKNLTIFVLHEKYEKLGMRAYQIWMVIPQKRKLTNEMYDRMLQANLDSAIISWGMLGEFPALKIIVNENCTKDEFTLALIAGLAKCENFEKNIVRGEK